MDMLRERTEMQKAEVEKAQRHNELINENFLKIKNLVHAQFDEDEVQDVAEDQVEEVVEETPLYISPANVTNLEQAPIVTEYAAPMAATVFTAQKFEIAKENTQPVEYTAPVQATERAVEVSYALTPLAKVIMAAFTFVVVAMLALICMNTQIIRQKSIRIQNLEEKKQQLLNQVDEMESRIAVAQSEETILQYALENGIVLGN